MVSNGIPAYVLGVGLTKFIKPRRLRGYPEMGYEAGVKAMLDAQINYDDVETGVACSCMAGTSSGQRIFYQFGMSTYVVSCKALTENWSNNQAGSQYTTRTMPALLDQQVCTSRGRLSKEAP